MKYFAVYRLSADGDRRANPPFNAVAERIVSRIDGAFANHASDKPAVWWKKLFSILQHFPPTDRIPVEKPETVRLAGRSESQRSKEYLMHFDDDGGWETVSREHETVWLFIPYDLAEDIWTERTGGANPSRLTLCRWMTANHLLLLVLAKNPGAGRVISRFQQDPRYMWVPVPAGSDLDLKARADHWEFCHGPDNPFDEDAMPIVRTLLH